jgi:hypothetical protein
MRIINEERRVRLDRGGRQVEGVVRVRGIHTGRTFRFGPVRSHDGLHAESHEPLAVMTRDDGVKHTHAIPPLRAGPPPAAFVIAPVLAVFVRAMLRRKGR